MAVRADTATRSGGRRKIDIRRTRAGRSVPEQIGDVKTTDDDETPRGTSLASTCWRYVNGLSPKALA